MRIVGLNNDMVLSSAALIESGRIVAAAAEERFSREKYTRKFPLKALEFCLKEGNCAIEDVDAVAVHWNPGAYLEGFNPLLSAQRRFKGEYLYSVPDYLARLHADCNVEHIEQVLKFPRSECRVFYILHHRAHAANGYYLSPFDEAAIFTADAQGELESTTYGVGRGSEISVFKSIKYPQSIGMLYASITEYLGFQPNSDEWKVMALASFADAKNGYYRHFKEIVKLLPQGVFELDLSCFSGYNWDQSRLFTQKMEEVFGPARRPEEPLTERHHEIAAALQRITEETVFHALNWLWEHVHLDDLVVSGGVFMNCVMNAKIAQFTPFRRIFVSSCPDDSGNAIGAALWVYHQLRNGERRFSLHHNFYGPEFSNEEIRATLDRYQVPHARCVGNVEQVTSQLIAQGKLVGWFQGRMEFGQRALGNRSILADPRPNDMKDRINKAVKYRESFRPFAPSVLAEHVHEYFEVPSGEQIPFMEKVYPVRVDKRSLIPAVVHVDGTGRLQTVEREASPRFYSLIEAFYTRTGIPLVLNTSFNLSGEPIVCTPKDAIRTFFSSGLDVLIMGNYLVDKVGGENT